MTTSLGWIGACGNDTRATWGSGESPNVDIIQYVTVDTTGDASDFGDLTNGVRWGSAGLSGNA